MSDPKSLRVIGVTTENVGCITLISLRPKATGITTIKGPNGSGKSTLLMSMQGALEGAKALPDCPIRVGQNKAQTKLELGSSSEEKPEYIVEQVITENGAKIVVTSADGAKYPSPAKLLAGLSNHIAFDPGAFARMKADDQDKVLKQLVGLDFTELDRKRQTHYDDRTGVNREVKGIEARLAAAQQYPDAPDKEIVVAELMAELEGLRETIALNAEARKEVESLARAEESAKATLIRCDDEIAKIEAALQVARTRRELASLSVQQATAATEKARAEVAELEDPDTAPLTEQIKGAEETNRKVRANADRMKLQEELAAKQARSAELTTAIQSIDDEKQRQIAGATFPIEGLGFGPLGPTFKNIPIAQASNSQKLVIGAAIGLALHPRIRTIWLQEASGIDDDTLDTLEKFCEEHDAQVFVEMVRSSDPAAIEIRDGSVVEKVQAAQ